MEDLDFGSLYENYEKEQAFLSAEQDSVMRHNEYLYKIIRFTITGDSLPVYIFVNDFDERADLLYGVIIRSYCPEYNQREMISVRTQHATVVENFDVVEHKNKPEILF